MARMKLTRIMKLETRIPLSHIEVNKDLLSNIKKHGIREPIEIRIRADGSMIVWDGLHRLRIAIELKRKSVPVYFTR